MHTLLDSSFVDALSVKKLGFRGIKSFVRTIVNASRLADQGLEAQERRHDKISINYQDQQSEDSDLSTNPAGLYVWIMCNDEVLSIVTEEEVLNAPAYVLFYSINVS